MVSNLVEKGTSSMPSHFVEYTPQLSKLWSYLGTWTNRQNGVNGPIVHRCDLKRMFSIHDTPWTQGPIIEGLVHLYRNSGERYWLDMAMKFADTQCKRLQTDGSFRWAGHEDDRYSSLVHNALADCGILAVAEILQAEQIEEERKSHYIATVEANIRNHLLGRLFNKSIGGFVMNVPIPGLNEATTGRFVANMNSVAVEAMIRLDLLRDRQEFIPLSKNIGQEILSTQCESGPDDGAFGYSKTQLHCCITIYTALTLRGFPYLYKVSDDTSYLEAAKKVLVHLEKLRDKKTGLWYHKMDDGVIFKYPIFVSGAGFICNGILDASSMLGETPDTEKMVNDLLRHQLPNGGIRNFIGYNHPDNGRKGGNGRQCWEDVFPTPNWNAQAFLYLSRVIHPPHPTGAVCRESNRITGPGFMYYEKGQLSVIVSYRPLKSAVFAVYGKALRFGCVLPILKLAVFIYRYSGLGVLKRKLLR